MTIAGACRLCPRQCGARRLEGERGFCGADATLRVARAALHFWEEPPLSGSGGSGTVFFSNCPLHCVYCQNQALSSGRVGAVISVERLAQIFLELQTQGAENINLVTGTHYAPQIIEALRRARDEGLGLPVVWNTSTYENVETIEMLADHIDIWLADFRYASGELAERYSAARDYPRVAARALRQMHQATPGALIVRILLLPDHLADAKRAFELSYEICGNAASYSLMSQYTPLPDIKGRYPELGCTVSADDYDSLVNFALDLGIRNSFMQVGDAASESFIPDFDLSGVLHV